MTENTYKNPVSGKPGTFGGDYPEMLTRAQVIELAATNAVGSSVDIQQSIDNFIDWLERDGKTKVDFRYANLTDEELSTVDSLVCTCDYCGWNVHPSEIVKYQDDQICSDCAEEYEDEGEQECDEENDEYDD